MPLLYRNVVPDVPAWTADNGKIVFRNGVPSHRAEMRLSITFGGSINFTGGLWKGPSSLGVFANSWTGAGVYDSYYGYANPWNYGEADIVTVDGCTVARRRIGGGQTTHDRPDDSGNWRATGWFFNGSYYDNVLVGEFKASLRGGFFYLDHTWDARGNAAPWTVRVGFDHNWHIRPGLYDERLWPDGVSGVAPVQLWQVGEPEEDPETGGWIYPQLLAGAVITPVLTWDCADTWPSDGFRLGTTHRFTYSGPAGKGIDISNVYIDITASYA